MMRRLVVLVLSAACLLAPIGGPARAAAGGSPDESRIGVLLMAACGMALKVALIAPVPWSGIAAMTCAFGLLDAALSEDTSGPHHP